MQAFHACGRLRFFVQTFCFQEAEKVAVIYVMLRQPDYATAGDLDLWAFEKGCS